MIISMLVKATALLLLALVTVRLARRARASVRHAILVSMFGALLALPLAAAVLPPIDFPMLPPTAESGVSQGLDDAASARGAANAGPTSSTDNGTATEVADQGVSAPAAIARITGVSSASFTSAAASAALLIWFVGAAFGLLTLIVSLVRLQRLRRSALPSLETARHLPPLARAADVARPVDVVVHEDIDAPITCGILRPAIVLPPDAPDWPGSALTRALVHELEHVKRRDWAVQIIARAVCALYWFHPLVWTAYRQLCVQAEHACDDAVVMREEDTMYADQLVTLARRMAARPSVAVLGMAQRSDLAARVSAVLDGSRARGRAGVLRAGAIAAAALGLLVALAPLQLVAAARGAPTEGGARIVNASASPQVESATSLPPNTDNEPPRQRPASRLGRALVEAADEGDLRDVRELIDDGANVNAVVLGDGSPLIAAARGGHMEIVRLLLDRGADVNLAVPGDGAPLIMAAREGHLAVVRLLLERGADIELMVDGDENALIQASGAGQLETVTLLVARGANVNARSWVERVFNGTGGEWRTPLRMALRGGHRAVADYLRASGAIE